MGYPHIHVGESQNSQYDMTDHETAFELMISQKQLHKNGLDPQGLDHDWYEQI